jgi:hypothetical protein
MYFLVLQKIIARGELSLVSLSLVTNDHNKLPAKVMTLKENIAADYELFIYKLLRFCI